jgi:hypothetical protein
MRTARSFRAAVAGSALLLTGACGGYDLRTERRADREVAPIATSLVRIGPSGLVPTSPVEVVAGEGGLAFANDHPDRPVAIVFPSHAVRGFTCSFTNGFGSDGKATVTTAPVPPGGIVSICVHEPGRFPFEVLAESGAPLRGVVVARTGGDMPMHDRDRVTTSAGGRGGRP